ncbi:glycosyltransferase family 2 protein [Halopseudomonas pelagia]|nr:glycosyltransferase family 2 protein [Halopseudomonas pelagia]
MITVLTPTFNRKNELIKLYQSLVNQTSKDFEWLIVDDGSTDQTPELIERFINQGLLSVRYFRQDNAGKHSALNAGFSNEENNEWIFIVDSDDMLVSDCIEVILNEVRNLSSEYVSIRMLQINNEGRLLGECFPNSFDSYFDLINSKLANDNADIFRKNAIFNYRFPVFDGEKFMAESPLFLAIGHLGKTKFLNYKGYIAEYLPGGLTDSSVVSRHRYFNSTLYVYENKYIENNLSYFERFKSGVNWWRFRLFKGRLMRSFSVPYFFMPFGFVLYLKDVFHGSVDLSACLRGD